MTGAEVLETVLARIADSSDGVVYITEAELAGWPVVAVSVLKDADLLVAASSARSTTCDGCERQCNMAVEVIDYPCGKAAFIFCDKLDDIPRIEVSFDRLRRWQATGEAVAAFLARSLGVGRLHSVPTSQGEWPVGRFRAARAGNVLLEKGSAGLLACVAGHKFPLSDVMEFDGSRLRIRREQFVEAVDHPVVGGDKRELRRDRAIRLAHKFDELKAAGDRAPRQTLAEAENVKVETVKKLLGEGRALVRGQITKKI